MKKIKPEKSKEKNVEKKSKPLPEPIQISPEGKTAKAVVRYLRIAPRKVRLVIDTIRYQPTIRAFPILMSLKQKAARITEKLLKSAVANAKGLGMDENRLVVSKIYANGGPHMKRIMARSMGRANQILKRTTHLSIELKEGLKVWPGSGATFTKKQADTAPETAAKSEGKKKAAAAK